MVSASVATAQAMERGVEQPADSTLEVIRLAQAITTAQQGGQLTQEDAVALTDLLRSREVEVNPRYGTFNPQTASVDQGLPSWLSLSTTTP